MKEPGKDNPALNALFWRDEILQIMYWLRGEHLGESISAQKLLVMLNTNEENLMLHLKKLVYEDYLIHKNDTYSIDSEFSLSEQSAKEAGRKFSEAFQGLQKAGHGECGPDCDCQWEGHDSCNHHHHDH